MSDAVHTSAPVEPDMFGFDPASIDEGPLLEVDGELIEDAQVRSKLVGDGLHAYPVLWLNLKPLNGLQRSLHVEQIYSEATRKLAEAKAATLKKGARVTVTTPVADMHVVFPHVREVALIP